MSKRSWIRGSSLPPEFPQDRSKVVVQAAIVIGYFVLAIMAGFAAIMWRIV